MRHIIITLSLLMFLNPLSAFAYGKRPIGATRSMMRNATTGTFVDRQVWLPGLWTVTQEQDNVTFRKMFMDGQHQSVVRIIVIPRDKCGYGFVRIRALKAWGGSNLEQEQGRIDTVTFGTIKFRGYTWMEPSTWEGDHHWCLGQDLTHAFELTATEGDHDLITFVKNDLMMQLAVRNGRSVLPWPMASEHSSSTK